METLPDDAIEELSDNSLRNMINERIKKTQWQWHYEERGEGIDILQNLENRIRKIENRIIEENKNSTKKRTYQKRTYQKLHHYTDIIFDVIKRSYSNGMNFKSIKSKTKLNDRTIRNVLYKLYNKGIIIRKQRGIYIINENTQPKNTPVAQPVEEEFSI